MVMVRQSRHAPDFPPFQLGTFKVLLPHTLLVPYPIPILGPLCILYFQKRCAMFLIASLILHPISEFFILHDSL